MKKANRHFAILISGLIAIFFILNSSPVLAARADVDDFVTRFYQQCLNREPDQSGLDGWVNALLDGSQAGADVAYGFIYSTEFLNKNTSNEDYLLVLYRAFFNREPDSGGWNGWLEALNSLQIAGGEGETRTHVLDGFLYSTEFENLCNRYGIAPYSS